MESIVKEKQMCIRNEVDEQGEDHQQEIGDISNERKVVSLPPQSLLPGQHQIRISRQGASLSHHGLPRWW